MRAVLKREEGTQSAQVHRRMTAVLRWRTRWLLQSLAKPEARATQLLPAFFQASFPEHELKSDAPGIEGVRPNRQWPPLSRSFDLMPPNASQNGRRTVSALLVLPQENGIEAVVVMVPNASAREKERILTRLSATESILRRNRIHMVCTALPFPYVADKPHFSRLVPFGALVAGQLPDEFWLAAQNEAARGLQATLSAQWSCAPTALLRIALLSLVCSKAPHPYTYIYELLSAAEPSDPLAKMLADPEWFCTGWSAQASGEPQLAFRTTALAAQSSRTKENAKARARALAPSRTIALDEDWAPSFEIANDDVPHDDARPGAGGLSLQFLFDEHSSQPKKKAQPPRPIEVLSPAEPSHRAVIEVIRLGNEITMSFLRAAQRLPRKLRQEVRQRKLKEFGRSGLPHALVPALRDALEKIKVSRLSCVTKEHAVEVVLNETVTLARGSHEEQAWLRAMMFFAATLKDEKYLSLFPQELKVMAHRLQQLPARKSLLLSVSPAASGDEVTKVPVDSIAYKRAAALSALAVIVPEDGRPSARRLDGLRAIETIAIEGTKGASVEVFAGRPECQAMATRLQRLADRFMQRAGGMPLTVDVGSYVIYIKEKRLFRFSLERLARRPRAFTLDPESGQMGSEVTGGRSVKVVPGSIDCMVWQKDDASAWLLYSNSNGFRLLDSIALAEVETHFREVQTLLRAAVPPCAVGIRAGAEISRYVERHAMSSGHNVPIALEGTFPFHVTLVMKGIRYQSGGNNSWRSAADVALSSCPADKVLRIVVQSIEVSTAAGTPLSGLLLIYVRAWATRRLNAHITRACRP